MSTRATARTAHAAAAAVAAALLVGAAAACLDDVVLPPDPPTLDLLGDVVRTKALKGKKPPGSSVLFGEDAAIEIVPADGEATWRATVLELQVGENDVVLWSQLDGLLSYEPTRATVIFEPNFPDPPTVDQPLPLFSNVTPIALSGTKPQGARLLLDDVEIAPLSNEETWSHDLAIDAEGSYDLVLVAEDARGKRSEPVDVPIVFDQTPPAIVSVFPDPAAGTLVTNGVISVVFDGDMALADGIVDVATVTIRNGIAPITPTAVEYAARTRALRVIAPGAQWPASVALTVQLNHQLLGDLAGNFHAVRPTDWTMQLTTGAGPDAAPPGDALVTSPAPLGDADGDGAQELAAAPLAQRTLTISGTKPQPSSVTLNGLEVAPLDDSPTWSTTVNLTVGDNLLRVSAVSLAGVVGPEVSYEVARVVVPPNPPSLGPVPASVDDPFVELSGTRDADTTLLLDGIPVVPRGPDTAWQFTADLVPGTNTRLLTSQLVDEGEVLLSEPVAFTVEFAQQYEGDIGGAAQLEVELNLRDLADAQPISSEFETGDNNYGIDIWLEGPLDPGERCSIVGGDRQAIKYADTLVLYKGTKTGHVSGWGDEDYRNPDLLAALVTAGEIPSRPASSDRRRDDGSPNDGFGHPGPIGEDDLEGLDGITQATIKPDRTHTFTWAQSDPERPTLAQGEYLVHVVLNLDRSGSWLQQNDVETCWLDPDYVGLGMHRVTARMSFGATAYELELGDATETSGADVDQQLGAVRYLDGPIVFRWKPDGD